MPALAIPRLGTAPHRPELSCLYIRLGGKYYGGGLRFRLTLGTLQYAPGYWFMLSEPGWSFVLQGVCRCEIAINTYLKNLLHAT